MRFLKYFISGILVLYFQVLIAPRLSLWGVSPFFLLPFIIFISMNLRLVEAATIAFLTGLAVDVLDPYLLGVNTALLLTVTYLVIRYHTSVTKDKIGPVAISVLFINLIFFVPYYLLKGIIFGFDMVLISFFPLVLLYNSFVTIAFLMILTIIQKLKVVIDV